MQHLSHLYRLLPPLLALSFVTNLSILISPLFMMQVLDRVIPSGNQATLILLGALAVGALMVQAAIDTSRDQSLGRVARWVEKTGTESAVSQPDAQARIEQVAKVSQFLASAQAVTVLNLPWLPLLALVLFVLHPAFLALLAVLLGLTATVRWVTGMLKNPHEAAAAKCARQEQECLTKSARHHAKGAGTAANLRQRFSQHQQTKLNALDRAQSAKSVGEAIAAMLRQASQILALGLGAYLVTQNALSAGGMIAASLLLGKTFASTEAALIQFPAIKAAVKDLFHLRSQPPNMAQLATTVSDLNGALKVEKLIVPGTDGAPPRLDRITFALEPGECLVIAGGSSSGKTTLLKALAGIAPAPIGAVYLDESELRGLPDQSAFRHIGYLPQLAPALPGTIAENISSFDTQNRDDDIVAAAKISGMHGLISALPQSYDSSLEHQPFLLSAGQKQRLALTRAIFNTPAYLFLDEPNALLDAEGERALFQTLMALKEKGTTIVMVLHRSGVMTLADKVMRLEHGRMIDFGPRGEVLGRMANGRRQVELPLLDTSMQDLCDWVSAQFNRAGDADFGQRAQLVAIELFNTMRLNGAADRARKVKADFSFQDDVTCTISLSENAATDAATTTKRIQNQAAKTPFALQNLKPAERPIAALLDLAESLSAEASADATQISACISAKPRSQPKPLMKLA